MITFDEFTAAKHRVHYTVGGNQKHQASITDTFDNTVENNYLEWCLRVRDRLADAHGVRYSDIKLTQVVNL